MELPLREVLNAIFFIVRTGSQWRGVPGDFPKWQSVYYHYYCWMKAGRRQRSNAAVVRLARQQRGRTLNPTAGVIDSQSVKTTALARERGFDCFERIKGHKRQLTTDTEGHMLAVVVRTADIADCKGDPALLQQLAQSFPSVEKLWADSGYQGNLADFVQ